MLFICHSTYFKIVLKELFRFRASFTIISQLDYSNPSLFETVLISLNTIDGKFLNFDRFFIYKKDYHQNVYTLLFLCISSYTSETSKLINALVVIKISFPDFSITYSMRNRLIFPFLNYLNSHGCRLHFHSFHNYTCLLK